MKKWESPEIEVLGIENTEASSNDNGWSLKENWIGQAKSYS